MDIRSIEQIGVLAVSGVASYSLSLNDVEVYTKIAGSIVPIFTSLYILYKNAKKTKNKNDSSD
jgi:hypothetical protein